MYDMYVPAGTMRMGEWVLIVTHYTEAEGMITDFLLFLLITFIDIYQFY